MPVGEIQRGIRNGVRKVNVDTDIRVAMTGAMRKSFAQDRRDFDPRKALNAATTAAKDICKARFVAFGCAGQASKIEPVPLEKNGREISLTFRANGPRMQRAASHQGANRFPFSQWERGSSAPDHFETCCAR